ncbi:hypothetical protein CDD83_7544 [Cordyceps sp. RAO-2017]|nr:hypothetical protein CDD83_7544 [Cordyceps sp. RAO-2017]
MSDKTDQARRSDDESASVVVVTPTARSSEAGENDPTADKAPAESENKKEEAEAEVEESKKKHVVGLISDSKDLYAKFDERGNRSWTEKKPDDFEEAAENEETEKFAVVVRKQKPRDADSGRSLVIDSLIIQSPYLKRVLADVLDGYPGILTDVARFKLSAPFECLVHRWDRFAAALDNVKNDELGDGNDDKDAEDVSPADKAREHVELLQGIMREELGHVIQLRHDYFKNRAVSFEHAWTLFPPGCTVLGRKNGRPVAAKFRRGFYAETQCGKIYALQCRIIEWDGSVMGWADLNQQIPEFVGTMPFTSLPCYPIDYHDDPAAVKGALVERGRRWESLAGFCYRAYRGPALWHPASDPTKTRIETVQSRIVVDGLNWEKENYDHQVYVTALHKEDSDGGNRYRRRRRRGSYSSGSGSDSDSVYGGGVDDDDDADDDALVSLDPQATHKRAKKRRAALTEEQLLVTSPMVRGYALQNKRWMEFYVDGVGEVQFDGQAFQSLVMPADKKELILAFAQSQAQHKEAFDDVIAGKGRGIVLLLSGGPGIGKTLTAESVAEEMRVPLYAMSAGDLGSDAYDVESSLSRILAMVANWNAVLLLDECDVFLEARSPHDMERNRIVAVFLRTLEYYEGILFLTTNRVRDMDPAFRSRIHVALDYPPLDAPARAAVWRAFLARPAPRRRADDDEHAPAHDLSDADVDALSRLDLNGRVIKNVLKAAGLLACHRGERLAFGHLRTVLRVEGHSL